MKKLKLFFALFAMLALGVSNAWAETKIDEVSAIGFAGITTSGYTAAGTDYSAVANTTNNTSVTYAMQVFDGKTGAVRGNKSGNANFSCRNTTTCDGYYISKVVLTVTGGTLDGATNNRSVVYFGTSAYANPTTAPTGTSTKSAENATGTTLTWNNTNEEASYFILYNLKTSGTLKGGQVTITWTKKSGGPTPDPGTPVATLTADPTSLDFGTVTQNDDVAAKTFTISGSDLTAGELALTAPSGYTVSPATVAVDGTLANTTVTVTPNTTAVGSFNGNLTITGGGLTAAVNVALSMTVEKAPATPTGTMYVKVTDAVTDGEYLIVYEDAANNPQSPVAFNGALTTLDAVSNNIAVAISSNTIAGNTDIDAATFTIDATAKTVKSKSGYYIGQTSDANGLKANNSTKYENALSIENNGTATIKSGGAYLRYNSDANNWRFRYYKSSSYSGQEPIALYKKASSHTLTYGTCTNGSVSANVADGATVLSGTTITLSNSPATNYKLTAYDVYKTGEETTKVTVIDGKFIMPEFDVTISATFELAKTLTSIEITNKATQTTFWQGETFNSTGLKVTAHFNGAEDEDVTSKITVTGSTATAGTQTVTVSFTEGEVTKEVTYTITVKAIPNTKETAYTVADAFDIIDKLGDTDKMYITGFVSQADLLQSTIDQYKNADYWISADGSTNGQQLEAYRGKYLDNTDFTSVNQIMVGDEVIIYGKLTKYGSTYEFAAGNYLVSLKRDKQQPELSYTTTEYNVNLGDAFTAPTLNNPHILAVTYSTNNEEVATVAADGAVTIKAAGTVTITASFAGNDTYVTGSASYTINITDPNVSSVTFDATMDIPTEGLTLTKNGVSMTFTGGAMDNGENYRCYSGQKMTISYADGNITKIVLECTTNNDAKYGPGCFETETVSYSYFGKVGTWTGEAKSITFNAKDQVRMTAITVYYKQDNRTNAELAWSEETVTLTVGDAFAAPTFSNPNNVTGIEFISSNTELATVNNAGVISLVSGKTGTATITATFEGDDDYKAAEVKCTISVNPQNIAVLPFAFDGKCADIATTAGMSQEGIDVDDYASSPHLKINTTGDCLIIHFDSEPGALSYTIKANVNSGDFTGGFDVQVSENGDDYDVLVSYTELEKTAAQKTHKLDKNVRYVKFVYTNKVSGQNVALGNILISKLSVLRADLYDGKWGTFCPDQKVTYMQGASFYTLTYLEMKDGMPYKLFFDEITTDYLEAGKPYLFIAESEEIKGVKSGEVVSIASNYNGFYGNVSGNTISLTTTQTEYVADGDVVNNYGVINSRFTLLGDGTNVAHERAHVQIKNGQLDCPNPPASLPALAPGARRVVAGATGINTATGVDQVQGDNVPTKMIINGQLFILRGEKMYDAQGKLVK